MLSSKEVYSVLIGKGVTNFYHANTVRTSLTFIKEKALLSRAFVEQNKLDQTEQYTDTKDKALGIWDSAFLDAMDLHKHFGVNYYGPVLFEIDLNLLLHENFSTVQITKSNPANWSIDVTRFFESVEDFKEKYLVDGKFDKSYDGGVMFVFSSPDKKIDLKTFCKKIVLDDPQITFTDESTVYEKVEQTLTDALNESNLSIPIVSRLSDGGPHHHCSYHYARMYKQTNEKFLRLFSKSRLKSDNGKA